jgi:hypothetical protein
LLIVVPKQGIPRIVHSVTGPTLLLCVPVISCGKGVLPSHLLGLAVGLVLGREVCARLIEFRSSFVL